MGVTARGPTKSPTKVGTLTLVVGVLTGSLPVPVLERPDERRGGDFFGNRSKFVDNMRHDNGGTEINILSQSFRVGGLLFCLVFGIQMIVPGQQASNSDSPQLKSADVVRLVLKGYRLSGPAAVELEKALLADPKNLIAHITLVAYYTSQHDELSRMKKSEHALWLIRKR